MRMALESQVNAPIEQVFDAYTDLRQAADRIEAITEVEVLTDGPIRAGTKWRETRVVFGKEHTEEMAITALSRPNSYTVEGDSCGAHFTTVFHFKPQDGGTHVGMTMSSQNKTFFAKIMGPIMGFMMTGSMRKMMQKDLDQLKAYCEQAAS